MSAERDSVLKRIDNYDTELLEVKKNLLKENDPEKKAELIKRRDLLEGTIATMEKRALALTTQQTEPVLSRNVLSFSPSEVIQNQIDHLGRRNSLMIPNVVYGNVDTSHLQELKPEWLLVIHMTEIFQRLTRMLGPEYVLVNSETTAWLQSSVTANKANYPKPDLFVVHRGLHSGRKEPRSTAKEGAEDNDAKGCARDMYRAAHPQVEFNFGVLQDWRVRTALRCVLECKLNFEESDLAQLVTYLAMLSHNSSHGTAFCGLLFDVKRIWAARCSDGVITDLMKGEWKTPGVLESLCEFLNDKSDLNLALEKCSAHHGMRLMHTEAFLGSGKTGNVFKVEPVAQEGRRQHFALKIVLHHKNHDKSAYIERQHALLKAAVGSNCAVTPIGEVFHVHLGTVVGCSSYLMEEVGSVITAAKVRQSKHLLHDVLGAVSTFHAVTDNPHGDCRMENVLLVSGVIRLLDPNGEALTRKGYDFVQLYDSIFDGLVAAAEQVAEVRPELEALCTDYSNGDATVRMIEECLLRNFYA